MTRTDDRDDMHHRGRLLIAAIVCIVLLVAAPAEARTPHHGGGQNNRGHVVLDRQVTGPRIVVAQAGPSAVDDQELLELIELEVRQLLSAYEGLRSSLPVSEPPRIETPPLPFFVPGEGVFSVPS